jgi:hypothetical protein
VIGLVWGVWHIPLLVYYGLENLELILAVVGTIPLAVLYTWVYNNTEGSLLLVVLFHLVQQISRNVLMGSWPGYSDEILMWVIAILLILSPGMNNFSRSSTPVKQKMGA